MWSIDKIDSCADSSIPALLSYQEYLVTFQLRTSQVVQRARPVIARICALGSQRVKGAATLRSVSHHVLVVITTNHSITKNFTDRLDELFQP